MTSLPRAASSALWLNAWLAGTAPADDVRHALGHDSHHVFLGLDESRPLPWVEALGTIRQWGSPAAVALPVPGDPLGLAGPPRFNSAALEAGEALLLPAVGLGFVPVRVGGATEWRAETALPPSVLDPREARQRLRTELREVTEELVDLGITRWSTDIPDLLINRSDPPAIPPGVAPQDAQALTSAALCLAIVDAAVEVEPGAIDARERAVFEADMRRLDRAARRALVALCSAGSDSLTSP